MERCENDASAMGDGSLSFVPVGGGDVLLVGEAMVLFTAKEAGSLSEVDDFSASTAGAELNVAVGLARLQHRVCYLTKVGDDPFGRRIRCFICSNGIDDSLVTVDRHELTGFMVKSKVAGGDPVTAYWRRGSAASTLTCADIASLDWSRISVLHLTGILPALSDSTLEISHKLIREARAHDVFVSFDPNLRPTLWKNEQTMRDELLALCCEADMVLPGVGEGDILCGANSVENIGRFFVGQGARYCVVKDGTRGAYATDGQSSLYVPAFVVDDVTDTVGAGDGFAVGMLSGLLKGLDAEHVLERACAVGAIQTQSVSDNEGLPTPGELAAFIESHGRA